MDTVIRKGLVAADLNRKNATTQVDDSSTVIHPLVIPPVVLLPTVQHLGTPAEVIVKIDEKVLKGQLIARAKGLLSANIHAPTSGTVIAISKRSIGFEEAKRGNCIVIETDGKDQWIEREPCQDFQQLPSGQLLQKIRDAGIVDMDGEGLPAHIGLNPKKTINSIIVNACQWSNELNADDVLLLKSAREIVLGLKIIRQLLDQPQHTVIAIEAGKENVGKAIQIAIDQQNLLNCTVQFCSEAIAGPDRQQLIETITGQSLNDDGLAISIGCVCLNVATLYSIYRAVCLGEPSISQIVTINGHDFNRQQTLSVPLGTPISFILKQQGFKESADTAVRINSVHTGNLLNHPEAPINKIVSSLWTTKATQDREAKQHDALDFHDAGFFPADNRFIDDSPEEDASAYESGIYSSSNNKTNKRLIRSSILHPRDLGPDMEANMGEDDDDKVAIDFEDGQAQEDKFLQPPLSIDDKNLTPQHKRDFIDDIIDDSNIDDGDLDHSSDLEDGSISENSYDLEDNNILEDEHISEHDSVSIDNDKTAKHQALNLDNLEKNTTGNNMVDMTLRSQNIFRLQEKLKHTEDMLDEVGQSDEDAAELLLLSINVLIEKINAAKSLREKENQSTADAEANNYTLRNYIGSLQQRLALAQGVLSKTDRADASTQSAVKQALVQLESRLENALDNLIVAEAESEESNHASPIEDDKLLDESVNTTNSDQ